MESIRAAHRWLAVLALVLLLGSLPPANATSDAIDVSAEALTIDFIGENLVVTGHVGILFGADAPNFNLGFELNHHRGEDLVGVVHVGTAPVTHGTNCISCGAGCNTSCEVFINGSVKKGQCGRNGSFFCDLHHTVKKCICGTTFGIGGSVFDAVPGDVFEMIVGVSEGVVEMDGSNNSTSIVFSGP